MSVPYPVKLAVRTKYFLTSTARAKNNIVYEAERTLKAFEGLSDQQCRAQKVVPKMPGVDEDMRDWSYYMILEHNVIVNNRIRLEVAALDTGVPVEDDFDVKNDVMPSGDIGSEVVTRFQSSVEAFLSVLPDSPSRWEKKRSPHPVFGNLNIHGWINMFGFHLQIHRRQAEALRRRIG